VLDACCLHSTENYIEESVKVFAGNLERLQLGQSLEFRVDLAVGY
jgi:hypothetical protein